MPRFFTELLQGYRKTTEILPFFTGGRKFSWDSSLQNVSLHRKPYIFSLALGIVFGLTELCHTFALAKRKNEDVHGLLAGQMVNIGILMASGHMVAFLFTICFLQHYDNLQYFFNCILTFVKRYWIPERDTQPDERRKARTAKIIILLFQFAIKHVGIEFAVVSVILPTLPVNIFSYQPGNFLLDFWKAPMSVLIPQTYVWIPENLFVFVGNYIIWTVILKQGFSAVIEMIIGTAFLNLALLKFNREVKFARVTSSNMETLTSNNLMYRQIQILSTIFNNIESWQLVIFLVCFGTSQLHSALQLFHSSSYAGNTLGDIAELVQHIIRPFYFIVATHSMISTNFLFGCCGEVHHASTKILKDMRCRVNGKEPRIYRKLLRSYPTIRITFGDTNFIEKLTPIIFEMFLIQRLVDALLLR